MYGFKNFRNISVSSPFSCRKAEIYLGIFTCGVLQLNMASHENFVPNTQSQGKTNSVNIGSSQSIPETQDIVIIICVYTEINYFWNISKFYSQFAIILESFLIF